MKKLLKKCNLEEYFEPLILNRGRGYYLEHRILDIWYSDNLVTAYIVGSEIYRVKIEVKNNKVISSYCSCPFSEGGEYMCKHIAAVMYHMNEEKIPKLENNCKNQKEETKLFKIFNMMQYELRRISDNRGFVNYYNGSHFVDLITKVSTYIDEFITNKKYNEAYELIKYTYEFIKNTSMDGSNGEYQDSFYLVNQSASKLLYNDEYYDIFLEYAIDIVTNNKLDDFSDSPIQALILFVHDKDSAKKVIEVLDGIQIDYGIFVDPTLEKISLTYEYISKNNAIEMCYKNIQNKSVKKLLIDYLKIEKRIDELIKILKDDIKNSIRKDLAYGKLIEIYDEFNMAEEKKKILPKVIIDTASFSWFKKLKAICTESEWQENKNKILEQVNPNKKGFLEDVYREEKETEKLFDLLKKEPSLYELSEYQDEVKEKYGKELLKLYKPFILDEATRVSERLMYNDLCKNIKRMGEIDDSDDYIFEMLKEMYPNYKGKKAFKEEIMKVLSPQNKTRFAKLIQK